MYVVKLFVLFTLTFLTSPLLAGQDTTAYELQRTKVNNLLKQRSARFGQYDQSLRQRTGIFGLKTKRDMQASIDILTSIVQTDNDIFAELKILLDYKDMQKDQVEYQARVVQERIGRYQATITRLQQQNDKLRNETSETIKEKDYSSLIIFFLVLALAISLYFNYRTKKLRSLDKA